MCGLRVAYGDLAEFLGDKTLWRAFQAIEDMLLKGTWSFLLSLSLLFFSTEVSSFVFPCTPARICCLATGSKQQNQPLCTGVSLLPFKAE